MKKIVKFFKRNIGTKILGGLLSIVLILVVVVNLTPTPIALLARITVFSGDAGATPPKNYDSFVDNVEVKHDLIYPSKNKQNSFDIYYPKDTKQEVTYPLIVWVHGGGFVGGDKQMTRYYATTLANEGYVVAAINYSKAPDVNYPVPVEQLADFTSYISKEENYQDYPIDIHSLFFAGDSAGAQITSQFILAQSNPTYAKDTGLKQVVNLEDIKGLLLYCGPYNITHFVESDSFILRFLYGQIGWSYFGNRNWATSKEAHDTSIVEHVDASFPPAYITDGNTISFEDMARELIDKLDTLNVPTKSRFFDLEKDGEYIHEFQFQMQSDGGKLVFEDTVQFLKEYQ